MHKANIKEVLICFISRHAGESRHPVSNLFFWIPAFAGMTISGHYCIAMRASLKRLSALDEHYGCGWLLPSLMILGSEYLDIAVWIKVRVWKPVFDRLYVQAFPYHSPDF